MKLIIILLSIACIYPNEGDAYTFIIQHNLEDPISNYRTESMIDFAFGSYQNSMNSDYKVTEKYLGEKDGFLLIEKTTTDMVATTITFGEVIVNNELLDVVGIPYTVFIDSSGEVEDVETEHLQFEELIRSMELDMGGTINYIYPFGEDAVDIKLGESWSFNDDSMLFYPGDGEFENFMKIQCLFTLDKIKEKKGSLVAYISSTYNISVEEMLYQQSGKFFEGYMTGSGKGIIRYDLTRGRKMLERMDIGMKWNVTFEDKHLLETMNVNTKTKWKK